MVHPPVSGRGAKLPNNIAALAGKCEVAPETIYAQSLAEALQRVARNDCSAFEEVYRRTADKLLGVCLTIVRRRSEAEDVLQDVYCSVWRSAALFDARRGTAMTWLITLARNRSVDRLRRSRSGIMAPIEWASSVVDPQPLAFETIEADDEHRQMRLCLGLLSERDSNALTLAFFGGVTYAELATAACIPVGTMKSRMRRALKQMRVGMR